MGWWKLGEFQQYLSDNHTLNHLGSYDVQLSPLHIAAKLNLKLFKEIAPKLEDNTDKNYVDESY